MTDIVKRLREPPFGTEASERNLMNAAADEITSLIIDLQHAYGEVAFQTDKVTIHGEAVTRLTAEVDNLKSMVIVQEKLLRSKDAENERLRAEVSGLNQVFDAQWSADMRAIECWRKVNPGNELVLPDHADLCLWLMEERTRLTAEVEDAHRREACAADFAREWEQHCKTAEAGVARLTAENAKLRAALKEVNVGEGWAALIARAALEGSA